MPRPLVSAQRQFLGLGSCQVRRLCERVCECAAPHPYVPVSTSIRMGTAVMRGVWGGVRGVGGAWGVGVGVSAQRSAKTWVLQ